MKRPISILMLLTLFWVGCASLTPSRVESDVVAIGGAVLNSIPAEDTARVKPILGLVAGNLVSAINLSSNPAQLVANIESIPGWSKLPSPYSSEALQVVLAATANYSKPLYAHNATTLAYATAVAAGLQELSTMSMSQIRALPRR